MNKNVCKRLLACLLALVMITGVFAGCQQPPAPVVTNPPASAPPTTPPPPEAEPIFSVVNPRPSRAAIDAKALAPRLDSLEGKTVAVIANYNGTMAPLAQALLDTADDITVIFISDLEVARGQSPRPIELDAPIVNMSLRDYEADPSVADALVFGNGF